MKRIFLLTLLAMFLSVSVALGAGADIHDEDSLGNNRWRVENDGDLLPTSTYDIGSASYPVANLYVTDLATTGKMVLTGERDAITGYEYYLNVTGDLTGTSTQGNTRGIYVDLVRSVDTTVGDQNDAGIMIDVKNTADGNTSGNTLQGISAQASNDATGAISNLVGGTLTAYNKNAGGIVGSAIGAKISTKANNQVTSTMIGAEITYTRQAAYNTAAEDIVVMNCNSSIGTGIDSAITIASTYSGSASTDSMNDGINMTAAAINQAQIVFSNGSKLFVGAQTSENGVYGEVGAYDAVGSVYFGAGGTIFTQVADNGANADWETVTSASAE